MDLVEREPDQTRARVLDLELEDAHSQARLRVWEQAWAQALARAQHALARALERAPVLVRLIVRVRNESSGGDHALAEWPSSVVDLTDDGAEPVITSPPPHPHPLRTPPDAFIVNMGFEVSHRTVNNPDDGSEHSEATDPPDERSQHSEATDPPDERSQHPEPTDPREEEVGSWPLSGPTLQVIAQAAADELRNAADSATDPRLKVFLKAITLVGFVGAFAGIGMRCAGRSLSLVMFRIAATAIALGVIVALVMDLEIAVALFIGAVAFLISVASIWLP